MKKDKTAEQAYLFIKVALEFICTFYIIYITSTQIIDFRDSFDAIMSPIQMVCKIAIFFTVCYCFAFLQRHWLITLTINGILPMDFVGVQGNQTTDEQSEHYSSELVHLRPFKVEYTAISLAITILDTNAQFSLVSDINNLLIALIFVFTSIIVICNIIYHFIYREEIAKMDQYYETQHEAFKQQHEAINVLTEEGYNKALQNISQIITERISDGMIDTSDWEDSDWDEAEAADIVRRRDGEEIGSENNSKDKVGPDEYFITMVLAKSATESEAVESFREIFRGIQKRL